MASLDVYPDPLAVEFRRINGILGGEPQIWMEANVIVLRHVLSSGASSDGMDWSLRKYGSTPPFDYGVGWYRIWSLVKSFHVLVIPGIYDDYFPFR